MKNRIIIETADGSHTLYLPEMDEQYHSVNGAITESNYVFLEKGYLFHLNKKTMVFELGFGTGLNCLLTALQAEKLKRPTVFYSIEKYPLEKEIIKELNYGRLVSKEAQVLFEKIHNCEWNKQIQISEFFTLKKIEGDISNYRPEKNLFDVIYFDAFGPDKQPNLWNLEIYKKIYALSAPNAVFVTYSAKGEVRRQLASAGYIMERLPGPPGKNQMLRGIKTILDY